MPNQSNFQSHEDRVLSDHLRRQDLADYLSELTYTHLDALHDEASERGDWQACDDLHDEMSRRERDMRDYLRKTFKFALTTHGAIPMMEGAEVVRVPVHDWLTEALSTNDYTPHLVAVTMGESRDALTRALANDYVADVADDLLRADWVPE